jgi:putative ABC transport system substrate-binding protein
MLGIRRREFIVALGGAAAVSWPLAAGAQQRERVRRIGMLMILAAGDPRELAFITVFVQSLHGLGWIVGDNLQIDYRFGAGDVERYRQFASELVVAAPDVLVPVGAAATAALQRTTRTVPIVFVNVTDPVGGGLVASLARPGGNTTGFMSSEYAVSGKWLELLKQIAPSITRAAVLRDPGAQGVGRFAAIQAVAPSLRVELSPIDVREAAEIEPAIAEFAKRPNGGLIVQNSPYAGMHRDLIIMLAARYQLPAVYSNRGFVASGGLISYGPVRIDQPRLAAGYVDRILRGEKPADLPVQAPTKYETVINLKTAKALGLDIPATVYARADEVIE